jgi:amino acid transporter
MADFPSGAATVRPDAGMEAARAVYIAALVGIASRLFLIFACARRILFARNVLNGGAATQSQAYDADSLVKTATFVNFVVVVVFVLTLVSLSRRRKRGDALAAAVDKSRAVRIAGRLYLLAALASVFLRNAFQPNPDASRETRIQTLIDGDYASIALQAVVIGFLVVIALVVHREIRRARAAGRVG